MIAVDTSALMAVFLGEEMETSFRAVLAAEERLLISSGTVAELLVVAARRGTLNEMLEFIDGLPLEIIPVTPEAARRMGLAYAKWGKGLHPAGLNFGDCFAYDVAKTNSCKLLFAGNDFSRTDLAIAL